MPIDRLPNELLLQIFAKGFRYPKYKECDRNGLPQLQASLRIARQVSRRWQHLIDSTHSRSFWLSHLFLFLNLYLSSDVSYKEFLDSHNKFLEGLAGAKESYIAIQLKATAPYHYNQLPSEQIHMIGLFTQAIQELVLYQENIISLDINFEPDEFLETLAGVLAQFRPSNLLSEFTIANRRTRCALTTYETTKLLSYRNLESLDTLDLERYPIAVTKFTDCTFPKELTTLSLACEIQDMEHSGLDPLLPLFAAVTSCQMLTRLDIRLCSGFYYPGLLMPTPNGLFLPMLLKLKIRARPFDIFSILSTLHLPNLKSMSLSSEGPRSTPEGDGSLTGTLTPIIFNSLIDFEFSCIHSAEWFVLDWIRSRIRFPNLAGLTLSTSFPYNGPTIPIIPKFLSEQHPKSLSLKNMYFMTIKYLLPSLDLSRLESLYIHIANEMEWHDCKSNSFSDIPRCLTPNLRELRLDNCCFEQFFPILNSSLDLNKLRSLDIQDTPTSYHLGSPETPRLLQPVALTLSRILRIRIPILPICDSSTNATRLLLGLFPNAEELTITIPGEEVDLVDLMKALEPDRSNYDDLSLVSPKLEKVSLYLLHYTSDVMSSEQLKTIHQSKGQIIEILKLRREAGCSALGGVDLMFVDGSGEVQHREVIQPF